MPTEEQTQHNAETPINNDQKIHRCGQKLIIPSRVVSKLSFLLSKYGSPTGNLTFGIRRVSDDSLICSKAMDVSGLSIYPTFTWTELTFDDPQSINEQVRIYAEYLIGDAMNTAVMRFQNTDVKANEHRTYFYKVGWNDDYTTQDAAYIYTYAAISPPTVTTDPATEVEATAATLKGTLDSDGGEACDCGFEWGETIGYGNTTPTQSRTTGQTFAQTITGLDPNKTYHFRAIATNSAGTSHGADRTLKTLVSAPAVTTKPATGLGAVLATLNGTLEDDIGEACECGFEWGLDTDYGITTPTESKITDEDFSQVIGGLIPNTVYHFRAFATNSFGTGYGADESFTTALVISRAFALAREEL